MTTFEKWSQGHPSWDEAQAVRNLRREALARFTLRDFFMDSHQAESIMRHLMFLDEKERHHVSAFLGLTETA